MIDDFLSFNELLRACYFACQMDGLA